MFRSAFASRVLCRFLCESGLAERAPGRGPFAVVHKPLSTCFRVFVIAAALLSALPQATRAQSKPPDLWLYHATNLQVAENIDALEKLWRRAAGAGYSHVLLADSKLARLGSLGDMQRTYFGHVERVKRIASELKLEIVPAVFHVGYSNSMLWHDPNLAEGLPVKDALFVVKGGAARLVADPPVSLGPKPSWKDDCVTLADSVATVRNHTGNARLVFKLSVSPFRCYHVSARIRTADFRAAPQIAALAGNATLQYQGLDVKRTQDWTEHHVVFNPLENKEVSLYFGVWGDSKGELQWKDWRIEEVGLYNVLRRDGAPCVVKGYVEGKDYEPILDPKLGRDPWAGEYAAWHDPPVIKTRGMKDGTELRVSWYHPAIIHEGQVSCCPSEPKTMALLADEARRVHAAFGARGYMMSHDEVRTLNWDESCRRRDLDAGAILADNVRQCVKLLAGREVYVWSDMFDPTHNAKKDYYLVRGSLEGSWEGLDPRVTIVNWNFDQRDRSLKFFAERGHRQVIAGYYDGPVEQVRQWLDAAGRVKGVVGVMYTTWQNKYDDLEKFAQLCR